MTQEEVDALVSELQNAINALEKAPTVTTDTNEPAHKPQVVTNNKVKTGDSTSVWTFATFALMAAIVYVSLRKRTKEELYLSILDNIQDGVYYVDIHRKIKFWNKGAEQITGYQADEMLGLECSESKLNHIDEFGNHLCITGCPLFATNIDGVVRTERVFVRHKNGYRIPLLGRNMVSTDVSAENI